MTPIDDALFVLPDADDALRVSVRLATALVLGAVLGYQRERAGKAAGLRTHILVALGAALFVLAPLEAGMSVGDLSRVLEGVITGIGFLGAGAILKLTKRREVQGLTTAANIWFTAAIGVAVGSGHLWLPVLGTALAWLVLGVVGRMEARLDPPAAPESSGRRGAA